jgi:hypothetical protein
VVGCRPRDAVPVQRQGTAHWRLGTGRDGRHGPVRARALQRRADCFRRGRTASDLNRPMEPAPRRGANILSIETIRLGGGSRPPHETGVQHLASPGASQGARTASVRRPRVASRGRAPTPVAQLPKHPAAAGASTERESRTDPFVCALRKWAGRKFQSSSSSSLWFEQPCGGNRCLDWPPTLLLVTKLRPLPVRRCRAAGK